MKIRIFLVIIGLFGCAQKMVPPNPDRFPPKLEDVQVQNRTKISVIFNEDIDPQSINKDSILITSENNKILLIKNVTTGRQNNTITLITEKQQPIRYLLSTEVRDMSENRAKVQGRFMGSLLKDTFPPRITSILPKTGAVKQRKNVRVILGFSEEVDTVAPISWLVLPKALKSRFNTIWQPNFRQLNFNLIDSLGPDTVVYFTLMRTVFDFEGNRLMTPGFTFFTSDTLLNTKLVTGKITEKNKPVANSFVIFSTTTDSMKSTALSLVDSSGGFAIQIREGIYEVSAIADTNFDDLVDLSGHIPGFNTTKETLNVELYPDSLAHNLDWYIH